MSRLLSAMVVPIVWLFVAATDVTKPVPTAAGAAVTTSTHGGKTPGKDGKSPVAPSHESSVDSSMIQRALYVLIGITMIGVLYFLIRAVRLKKPAHRKKYGLLSSNDDSVEMEAVESDEDTLYEARGLRR